jgi:CobW/HypB/UreG, nucleotide-binding domain
MKPTLIFVGGFLGAGKTTLILAAARELKQRGMRSAAILNDQCEALVDTQLAELQGIPSGEVTEGCFCCRLSDLSTQLEAMRAYEPDVIFAEPVGSCTDIAATVLHPLLEDGAFRLAPFTVLVDPERASALTHADEEDDVAFLFRKQLEEADLVCFTKSDIYPKPPELDLTGVRQISAHAGQGVAAWLDEVLAGELSAKKNVLEIDYARYVQAEAALAWMNLHGILEARAPISPAMLIGPWLDGMDCAFTEAGMQIVHLKTLAQAETGYVKAALCANGQEPAVEGALDASPAIRHEITLNIRALADPEKMSGMVKREFEKLDGEFTEYSMRCFRPAPPRPERRVLREEIAARR